MGNVKLKYIEMRYIYEHPSMSQLIQYCIKQGITDNLQNDQKRSNGNGPQLVLPGSLGVVELSENHFPRRRIRPH